MAVKFLYQLIKLIKKSQWHFRFSQQLELIVSLNSLYRKGFGLNSSVALLIPGANLLAIIINHTLINSSFGRFLNHEEIQTISAFAELEKD
jgi:hypothetical protein